MGADTATSSAAARRRAELSAQGRKVHAAAVAAIGSWESVDHDDRADIAGPPAEGLRTLDGQLAILSGLVRERLQSPDASLTREQVVELSELLYEVHTVRFGIHDHLGHERLLRLDQLEHGLARLRMVTDQNDLLQKVCEAAVSACGFERVMLSRVDDDEWRPWRSHSTKMGEAELAFREWIKDAPRIQLSHMVLESELVRRREPVIVMDAATDPRVYASMTEASALSSYVAAPIVAGDRVIGLLHADNRGVAVAELDRDILWFFAIAFAQIFERAVLLARLRDQRAEVMNAMRAVQGVLDDLATGEIDLAQRAEPTALTVSRPIRPIALERSPALEAVLTSREIEVLTLMATGATNQRIATQLVVGIATVKSHVKQILRKLRVENRAEAISYYLRLTIGARED